MGMLLDFLGGMGDAAKTLGIQAVQDKAAAERDEANFLKERNLAEMKRDWDDKRMRAEHGLRMDQAGVEAEKSAEQKGLDREVEREKIKSDERRANSRIGGSGKAYREVTYLDEDGNEVKERYPIDASQAGGGAAAADPNAELTPAEIEKARIQLSTQGGADKANDWVPGNEPSDDAVKSKAYENRNGGKSSATTAPATKSARNAESADPLLAQLQANRAKNQGGDKGKKKDSGMIGAALPAPAKPRSDTDKLAMPQPIFDNTPSGSNSRAEYEKTIQAIVDKADYAYRRGYLEKGLTQTEMRLALNGKLDDGLRAAIVAKLSKPVK